MRRVLILAVLVGVGATVWAGFGSAAGKQAGRAAATSSLTIVNVQGTTWTCGFNPFDPNDVAESFGTVYEELTFVNALKSGQTTPWLATSYAWSNHNRTLTFTIRSGVKWSDGKPFSASDVLFTFKLLKKFPGLDTNASWSVLKSVSQKGNKIVFNFKTSGVPYFYYVADQTPIVAKHIWSSIKNPVTNKDAHPVGTGPYKMASCSPQNIKYTKNAGYWQKGVPKIDTVYYPAFTSNDPGNQQLANGKGQWGSQFIPNINAFYLSKSKDNHYWFPPLVNVSIFINLKDPVLSNLAVRKAMAYAIDRSRVSKIGEYGYEPASNQTGIVTPTFSSWLDQGLASKITYNPQKAISILTKAGFKKGPDGIFAKNGQKLSFTIINNGGFSDWVNAVNVIVANLKAVGIQVTPQDLSQTTYQNKLYAGQFELGYGSETGGPGPYFELRQWLYSANSAPIGTPAGSNFERYKNPATDALINQFSQTTDPATQKQIISKLELVMLKEVPVIPVTESVDWFQYDTGAFNGWPTPSNPYAQPAAYNYPDWAQVMMHLTPKK
jgi:peptide/nickel transport system substrate-binding protein